MLKTHLELIYARCLLFSNNFNLVKIAKSNLVEYSCFIVLNESKEMLNIIKKMTQDQIRFKELKKGVREIKSDIFHHL